MAVLPTYRVIVEDDASLDFLSLVEFPATEVEMLKFSDDKKESKPIELQVTNRDRRIILAPVALADTPIYRREGDYEYQIIFEKDAIEKMAKNFFKSHRQENFDTEHNYNWVSGVTVFQSLIVDESMGISAPSGFGDVPEGTWFVGCYVNNAELWDKIQDGEFKGLSLAGYFNLEHMQFSKHSTDEDLINEMKAIYKNLTKL